MPTSKVNHEFKVGDVVFVLGRKRTIVEPVVGVDGGWRVDKPVVGFRFWNSADMREWHPRKKPVSETGEPK